MRTYHHITLATLLILASSCSTSRQTTSKTTSAHSSNLEIGTLREAIAQTYYNMKVKITSVSPSGLSSTASDLSSLPFSFPFPADSADLITLIYNLPFLASSQTDLTSYQPTKEDADKARFCANSGISVIEIEYTTNSTTQTTSRDSTLESSIVIEEQQTTKTTTRSTIRKPLFVLAGIILLLAISLLFLRRSLKL